MKLNQKELKEFLDEKADRYNRPEFIECDPISIPHGFTQKEDIEIAGFLAATIAWGNRVSILHDARRMMAYMGNSPYDFVMNHRKRQLERINGVIHRTFNSEDFIYFIKALRHIYLNNNGMEHLFSRYLVDFSMQHAIHKFKESFFEIPHPSRTVKHVSDPLKGSAAKRINMFLRWMVRRDNKGVDFGIWTSISPSDLSCPLDVHSGRVARKLGLLKRNTNDAKAVYELDLKLRQFDRDDPVKYDFALFGLGVSEGF